MEVLQLKRAVGHVEPDWTVVTQLHVFNISVEVCEISGHGQLLRIEQRALDPQIAGHCRMASHVAMQIALQKRVYIQMSEVQINQSRPSFPQTNVSIEEQLCAFEFRVPCQAKIGTMRTCI